jgi:hypothetical protein
VGLQVADDGSPLVPTVTVVNQLGAKRRSGRIPLPEN